GQRARVPEYQKTEAREQVEEQAKARVGVSAKDIEEARQAIASEAKKRPYKIDFIDDPRAPFFEPKPELGTQIVVYINKAHAFYSALYSRFLSPQADRQAKEAVDVVLIALARAELIVDDDLAATFYEAQRGRVWSPFLNDALRILAQTMRPED